MSGYEDNPNASRDQLERLILKDDEVVDMVLRLTRQGEKEFDSRRKRYDHSYEVYRASENRPKGMEAWQSQLRVPYGRQVIDTELVNIVSGFPRCLVKPRNPEDEQGAKSMQKVMDYEVAADHLVEKQPAFVQQGLIYGTTLAKNHWLYKESMRYARDWSGLLGAQVAQRKVVLRDGPTFEPWNLYDSWWDANGRDVDSSQYFVLRSWMSKDQLLDQACTRVGPHDPQECDGVLHNINELFTVGTATNGKAPTNTAQASYLGGQRERYKDLFEVLEIWTDDTVVVVGSRKVLLRNDPNPYWHGRKPIVLAQPMPDLFELSGIAETELIDHLQSAMWTLQNMVVDNLHLTVMRGITYREGGVTDPNALVLKPRFKWGVQDHDDVKPFEINPISSDVYNERQRMLADMQLVTGVNPYVSGSDLQSVDQNTATGVTALQEVASRLLRFKASQIQYKGYQRSFEMWGDMVQQFMDRPTWVNITGEDGKASWHQVTPQEVAGDFDYKLEGTEESLSRQQERGEAIAVLNAFMPLIQSGQVNPKPIFERIALAYGFEDPRSLFTAPPGAAAPQQPPTPGGQQMDPQQLMQAMQNGNAGPPGTAPPGVPPPGVFAPPPT